MITKSLARIFFITVIAMAFVMGLQANASTSLRYEGKSYTCEGDSVNIVCDNHTCTCNGVPAGGSEANACGEELPTRTHENGGGQVGDGASVTSDVFVEKGSAVCGTSSIIGTVEVRGNSLITGSAFIYGSKAIISDSTVAGQVTIGDSNIIGSKIAGEVTIEASNILNSNIAGKMEINGRQMVGENLAE